MTDNPLLVNMDEKDQYKGTLFIEAYDSLIDSITGEAQSELDIAFNAIGAVASTVSLVMDPFGSVLGAGFGWVMEHVGILKDLLDEVMGDPEDIQANVEATKAKAAELRVLAEDHRRELATFDGWTGAASEKYQLSMDAMGKELDGLASAVEGKAKIVAMMGTLVSVLRDIVRDAIAQLLGSATANGLIGAAGAIFTFGGSLVYAGIQIAREAAELALTLGSKVRRVIATLAKLMSKVVDLDGVMGKLSKSWERFDNAADVAEISYATGQAYTGVDDAIDKAVRDDAAKDELDAAYDKSEEASAKYQAAKDAESKQADDVSKANADLSAASDHTKAAAGDVNRTAGELNRTNEETNRAAEAVNQAAKSGDQRTFDAARNRYDAAKAKSDAAKTQYDAATKNYDTAKTKASDAAATVARESREMSDKAKASYDALQAGKPADTGAKAAYEEYLKKTGGTADPALTAKHDAAKAANEAYEKANVDFMAKNAAAAEANFKAFASGTDADIKAAEQASNEAQAAGKTLEAKAAEAKSAGDEAQNATGGGAPASEKPADPLEHARQVNASTSYTEALKGGTLFGTFGESDDNATTPDTSGPTVNR
ncbi:hypothetical protein FXN61_38470 [Lentzea sp. PSKA42]|uniref:Uncharacterized protein n=1 Tax=Lentzea indica TaxID=2604800 RepID=A0ABX1FTE8_9PSEU|nr:hypothetical protein [Lentzea indica]NKE62316.1 hypothetical protein [Lentzea indica]